MILSRYFGKSIWFAREMLLYKFIFAAHLILKEHVFHIGIRKAGVPHPRRLMMLSDQLMLFSYRVGGGMTLFSILL